MRINIIVTNVTASKMPQEKLSYPLYPGYYIYSCYDLYMTCKADECIAAIVVIANIQVIAGKGEGFFSHFVS